MIRVDTRQTAKPFVLPAPIGGLNNRDGLADMPPRDAYLLDNWMPGTTSLKARKGHATVATITPALPVETLMPYVGGANNKMLAACGGSLYDVSAGGAAGAPVKSGYTSNRFITTMFSNAGAQFLIGVNGAGGQFAYNGAAFTDLAITGVTGQLAYALSFKGRIYFASTGQLGFYYLPVGQIQGAASYFDLSQQAQKGGYLVAIASFTMSDSGTGPNDYMVFITSEGEYIVYGGFDPSNIANWGLVGRYYSAPPIGRKCVTNYGSDLLIITTEGLLPFSAIRQDGGVDSRNDAITSKLGTALSDLNMYQDVYGWQATLYSGASVGGYLLLNVPVDNLITGRYYQFAMNLKTKAWTRFTGQNGISWALSNRRLFFGTADGRVCVADEGADDAGMSINLDAKQAYNSFDDGYGGGYANKHFHFVVLLLVSDSTPPVSVSFNTDYKDDIPLFIGEVPAGTEGVWDVSLWDLSSWGSELTQQVFTVSVGKIGQTGSIWMRASINGSTLEWNASRILSTRLKGLF